MVSGKTPKGCNQGTDIIVVSEHLRHHHYTPMVRAENIAYGRTAKMYLFPHVTQPGLF